MSIINNISYGLEQVRSVVGKYYDLDTSLSAMIQPSQERVQASRYGYRIVWKRWNGGVQAKINPDGGALPGGTGPRSAHMSAGYISSAFAVEITDETVQLTQSGQVSLENVLTDMLNDIVESLNAHDNVDLIGDGSGWLTEASSAISGTTKLTFAGATDMVGVNRCFIGRAVHVWNSTGTTKRAGGPHTIVGINYATGEVEISPGATGLTAGDRLSVVDLDAYGPTGPTTGSATWPANGLTSGAGFGGDSWRHGLYYANNGASNSYYLTKLRSDFPELLPSYISAGGVSAISWEIFALLANRIIVRRGQDVMNTLICVMNPAQADELRRQQVRIGKIDLDSVGNRMIDLPPQISPNSFFPVNGIPCFTSKIANFDRVDFFAPKNVVRVESGQTDYFRAPSGGGPMFYPKLNSSNYTTTWQAWLLQRYDMAAIDPGAGGYIDGLIVPPGYRPGTSYL